MIPPPAGGGARRAFVYPLQSRRDQTFYVGWTTDPVRRLVEHNAGHAAWSRRKRPWRLIGLERFGTADAAKQRERTLKRNPRMLQQFKRRMLNRAAAGRPRQVVG